VAYQLGRWRDADELSVDPGIKKTELMDRFDLPEWPLHAVTQPIEVGVVDVAHTTTQNDELTTALESSNSGRGTADAHTEETDVAGSAKIAMEAMRAMIL
jgi:hypothetical protein